MNNVTRYFEQAEIALAAYSNLNPAMPLEAYRAALQQGGEGMSPAQANRFASQWRVVDQYDGKVEVRYIDEFGQEQVFLNSTGVSATVFEEVFEEVATGKHYLAVRGTAGLTDLWTDLVDIAILGTPERQAQYAALKAKVDEWLANGTLSDGFSVAGHSLGGFLAAALASEYAGSIDHAYLYNVPGLNGILTSPSVVEQVWAALSPGVATASGMAAPISNLVATWDPVSVLVGTSVAP